MDDSDFQDVQQPAYPPSILLGGAALVVVISGIVVAVLMVSAASDAVAPPHPTPTIQRVAVPAASASVSPPETVAKNNLEAFVHELTPRLPELDRLLQAP